MQIIEELSTDMQILEIMSAELKITEVLGRKVQNIRGTEFRDTDYRGADRRQRSKIIDVLIQMCKCGLETNEQ